MEDKNLKVIEIYDKIAEKYSETFDKELSDKPFLDKFLEHLKKDDKILEIGSGTGRHSKYFADNGMKIEAIDLSAEMIKIAKKNYPEINFKKADFRKLDYGEDSFDAIWAGYCLFHINQADFLSVIKQVKNILKPNGIFGLVMQEGKGEIEIDEPFLPGEKLYIQLYSFDEIENILKSNGFEINHYDFKDPGLEGELPYRKMLIIAQIKKNKTMLTQQPSAKAEGLSKRLKPC